MSFGLKSGEIMMGQCTSFEKANNFYSLDKLSYITPLETQPKLRFWRNKALLKEERQSNGFKEKGGAQSVSS